MPNWNSIVAEEGTAVWKLLSRLLGNRSDAEDCFQETFVAALKASRRESVNSWPALLHRLATARAMDHLRRRYRPGGERHLALSAANAADRGSPDDRMGNIADRLPSPAEAAAASELSERLRQALTKLPNTQAEIFALQAFDGWSRSEIAARFDMTENAVGAAIHRARRRLRELLSEFQEPATGAPPIVPEGERHE